MQYRTVKKNGDQLSVLGFGCMRLPQQGIGIDKERAKKQLYMAIDKGVNYIDTAYPYHGGQSEPFLGEAITPDIRKKVKLATKLPPTSVNSKQDMDKILNNQLKKLNTDYIDYYLLHGIDEKSWAKLLKYDVLDFLDEKVKEGKIINPGFSFHGSAELFSEIIDAYPWIFCQIQYNYMDENFQAGKKGLEYAASKDIAVMVMEPLRGGTLTNNIPKEIMDIWKNSGSDRTPAQWALQWILDNPDVTLVLSGMNEEKHIEENIATACSAMPNMMTKKELETVDKVKEKYHELLQIPCTACRYCMPCPQGIKIPENFDVYNRVTFYKEGKFNNRFTYMVHGNGLEKGKNTYASSCIGCGKCVKACPQNIDIPAKLKLVEKEFEGLPLKVFETVGRLLYRLAR